MAALFFDSDDFFAHLKELPKDGFFAFNFSEGQHYFTGVQYYEGYPTSPFRNRKLNFGFTIEPGSINYIGDIVIKWNVPQEVLMDEASGLNTTASLALGLLGAALTKPKYSKYFNEDVGSVSLAVSYDMEGMQRRVKEKYNRDTQLKVIEIDGSTKSD
jgi:hypothetical protein